MCGINGIYGLKNLTDVKSTLIRMNQAIQHRGPDSTGVVIHDEIGLGHQRLAIIDLKDESNQPFVSQDKRYTLIFNGEVYNFKEVRARLDYSFKTESDTEVVLAAYMEWGEKCLSAFNGMFAFAIWDDLEKSLFVARDRLGIKPLYFHHSKDQFVFSSEIRGLLASGLVPANLSTPALVDYLRYQTVHTPNTILDGVQMLPPGTWMKLTHDEVKTREYWNLSSNYSQKGSRMAPDDVKKEVRSLLTASVERRLISDVSFGAFLSGGIDSSAVVGLMSQVSDKTVKTFSVTFDESEFSEARYAKMVAEKFGTQHTEIKLTPQDFLRDLPDALNAMDHPSGDGPNTFVVSRVTKEAGVTMALSGLGGDELFAGYDIFKRSVSLHEKRYLQSFPKALRQIGGKLLQLIKPSVSSDKIYEILKGDRMNFEYTYPLSRQVLLDHKLVDLLQKEKLPENAVFNIVNDRLGVDSSGITLPLLSKVTYAEIYTYMQNVLLRDTDQMSMAHALEVRVPFLDHELAEFVFGLGDSVKYPTYPKKLLVESLGELLPKEIVHRPKMGFTFPWESWMRTELKGFCEERLHSFATRDEINGRHLISMWSDFLAGRKSCKWSHLWYIIVLENWLDANGVK